MRNRTQYLTDFMQAFNYPEEARVALLKTYKVILNNEKANFSFEQSILLYESGSCLEYSLMMKHTARAAEISGEPKETVDLLMVLCLSEHMKELYRQRGLDMQIYHDSCLDFKSKLIECQQFKGLWGTFVTDWFGRFFNLTRFALGRLQFEIIPVPAERTVGEYSIKVNDPTINIHIPGIGPMKYEDCRQSFIQASKFFAPAFPDGVVSFRCGSWLLAPEHEEMLSPESNIRKFMSFFNIATFGRTVEHDFWRIFGRDDIENISEWPVDNSLRRAYMKAIKEEKIPHIGVGVFFMKDGQFL